MNKDHQLALVDYAVVYGRQPLSTFRPSTVEISDISTESIKLRFEQTNGTIKAIEIEWIKAEEPENFSVESTSDIKPKLVSMAKYAANRQGFSHEQVTKVLPPKSGLPYFMYVVAAVLAATMIKPNLVSNLLRSIGLDNGALFSRWLFVERNIKTIFYTTYGIHLAELLFVMYPKIKYYRMPLKTALTWAGMNFIEGFSALLRLNTITRNN